MRHGAERHLPTIKSGIEAIPACWPLASAETAASVANSASCYDRAENVGILAVVEPEREFIQIEQQILAADVMIVAVPPRSKKRPTGASPPERGYVPKKIHLRNPSWVSRFLFYLFPN
jgi:hypothetical protein